MAREITAAEPVSSKPLRILFIAPIGTGEWDGFVRATLDSVRRPDAEPTVVHLDEGPTDLEYHYYEHLNLHQTLEWVRHAEKERYDAAVIACFYDPGLREARELVSIPVIAPAEACMHLAATLGHRFSIIVGRRKWIPKMEDNVRMYGLESKLASFRSVDYTVEMMGADPQGLKEAILVASRRAIEEDGAEVIVLGCTMESGFMRELSDALGTPVLDPVIVAWKYAEMMGDMHRRLGLVHSKLFGYEGAPFESVSAEALDSREGPH
jgi:allantoin racemase